MRTTWVGWLDVLWVYFTRFIPAWICLICSNPSKVKWAELFINFATCLKSSKSLAFTPTIGYISKNGIIFSVRSDNLLTIKSPAKPPFLCLYLPQSKYLIKERRSCSSRVCWVIWNTNSTCKPVRFVDDFFTLIIKQPLIT